MESKPTFTLNILNLFELLDYMKEKAGVFILRKELDLLYSFLMGYKVMAQCGKVEVVGLEKLDEFSEFVSNELNEEYKNTFGWFGSIRAEYRGGEEGFNKFLELLNEFKRA